MADSFVMRNSDAVATDAVRTQPEALFDRALQEYGPSLVRLAAAYTNTEGDRDDLFQEIAFAIWQALPAFRGNSTLRTYLFRIAHNRGVAHLASKKSLRALDREDFAHEELHLKDPGPNPERRLEIEEQRRNMLAAVQRLPIVYRQVITLALEGLSYPEIADVLGVTEANVGIRLNRARKELRRILESQS